MTLCKWNGGACERETSHPSGMCDLHREEVKPDRVEQFLDTLKTYVGVTIWQGAPAFVSQGAPYTLEPC
jgi:hypothetical protein